MDFRNVIKNKYLKNGEAAEHLQKHGEPAYWMLTSNGKKLKKYSDDTIKTFTATTGKDQERKNFVESTIAKIAIDHCGKVDSILAITGPNIKKHLELYVRSGFAKTMHVAEVNPWTYKKLFRNALLFPEFYCDMLNLHQSSAESFKIDSCRFVDLDLMQTFKGIKEIINKWLKFQSTTVDGPKAFTFTAGIRKDGGNQVRFSEISKIFNILGAKLKSVDGFVGIFPSAEDYADRINELATGYGKSCFSRKFEFSEMGRVDRVVAFQYSDGSPMLCVLILYK